MVLGTFDKSRIPPVCFILLNIIADIIIIIFLQDCIYKLLLLELSHTLFFLFH